jgi:hypothetical protein
MRTTNRKLAERLLFATVVAATVMGAGIAGNVLGNAVMRTPRIGHIIAFEPSPDAQTVIGARLVVHRRDKSDCILDLDVLRRSGGSLVVESQVPSAGYSAHWAGARTSNDALDCGTDADLIVRRQYLNVLDTFADSPGGPSRTSVHDLGGLR